MNEQPQTLISPSEAARMAKRSAPTVVRWVSEGKVKGVVIAGRGTVIDRDDLKRYLSHIAEVHAE